MLREAAVLQCTRVAPCSAWLDGACCLLLLAPLRFPARPRSLTHTLHTHTHLSLCSPRLPVACARGEARGVKRAYRIYRQRTTD